MTDPNMSDFYGRVSRIQRMRAKGYGFEAPGTLGRSYYSRPQARRRSMLGPVLFMAFCVFLLKGTMYQQVGSETYNDRVAALMAGEGIEHVGGWLMQAEPVTIFVAGQIDQLLRKAK